MVNRYTSDGRLRHNDSYTPGGEGGRRPDRAAIVYAQRCSEAFPGVPVVLGGIEASLRRVAHYDYWSDRVRRSVLADAKADVLLYGNAERALVELAHRLACGKAAAGSDGDSRRPVASLLEDVRGVALFRKAVPEGWTEIRADDLDVGEAGPDIMRQCSNSSPAASSHLLPQGEGKNGAARSPLPIGEEQNEGQNRDVSSKIVVRLPSFEQAATDPLAYARASRVAHRETNPMNARPLVQRHGDRELWLTPPPLPLTTPEMDAVYGLPYARAPHPSYGGARIPAWEMIRFSVTILRGCFGGCSFCSITEHEGRVIQSRSETSILKEIEAVRDKTAGFTGVISDLGGPTANMYRMACRDARAEALCRRPSCIYPGICKNLDTSHDALIGLYAKARAVPGVKRVLVASGVRYDLAAESPSYVRELVTHHVGGYLKVAPEHTEDAPLARMMKPGIAVYDRFKALFDEAAKTAGKEYYLIPYFIAAHPGTTDEDMLNLALWLKRNRIRPDQVQTFLPSPMSLATAMYHTGINPLKPVRRGAFEAVVTAKGLRQRRLHKAFLRYHDPENWPLLREALRRMGRADLIGPGKHQLVPTEARQGSRGAGETRKRDARR
jgi:uncharacterized radical SAM protein YgiQ